MRRLFLAALTVLATTAVGAPTMAATVALDWEVENRFRLFRSEPARTSIVEAGPRSRPDEFLRILDRARRSTNDAAAANARAYDVIRDFLATPIADSGHAAGRQPFEWTTWQGFSLRRLGSPPPATRVYDDDYLYPQRYTIRIRVVGAPAGAQCAWRSTGVDPLMAPCDRDVLVPVGVPTTPTGRSNSAVVQVAIGSGAAAPTLQTEVIVRDRFILGLGESYAAGEGNPDRPQRYASGGGEAGQGFTRAFDVYWGEALARGRDPHERWWAEPAILAHLTPAGWWDPLCHRSLYSQQAAAAFQYAAAHPREAVTFASFACSGTEAFDGLLAPQLSPPGVSDFGWPDRSKGKIMAPQIEAALGLLCRNRLAPDAQRATELAGAAAALSLPKAYQKNVAKRPTVRELKCADNAPTRPVDAVILSIGGNDVGFSGAVKDALLTRQASDPIGLTVLAQVRRAMGVTPAWLAERRIRFDLPQIYGHVREAMKPFGDTTPVIQSTYPNPLQDQDGRFCDGPNDNRLFGAMHGILPDARTRPEARWRFEITAEEGRAVYDALWQPLNAAVIEHAALGGARWKTVAYGTSFDRRGWCAGSMVDRRHYGFPGRRGGQWVSYSPLEWDAYAPRQRLFRTANDVVQTQVGSTKSAGVMNRAVFATSGMFHPAAEAHTIIGAEVARVLDLQLRESGEAATPGG